MLPADLWSRLATLTTPRDADVFYLGSYSSRPHVATLRAEPIAVQNANVGDGSAGGVSILRVHKRTSGGQPLLVGTNAYILFGRAARALLRPVRVEADIWLSLIDAPNQCRWQHGIAGKAHLTTTVI